MKALLISFEFGEHVLGGLGRVINGLSAELRHAATLDIYLLYFDAKRLAISAKVFRCSADQHGQLIAEFSRTYAASCVELIQREGYDLVHFFSVHWIIGNIIRRVTQALPRQKIVYSIHSLIKYEQGTRRNPSSFFACEQQLIRSAHVLHVLNATSRDYLEQAYAHVSADKPVYVIPNGIQPTDALPRDDAWGRALSSRLRPRTFTVVCLSRWAHGKGLEYFVQAARQLLEAGHDVQFVLAGRKLVSWEMQWYLYLLKISLMTWGLGSRFVVLGWLNTSQRNALFARADAVVVPSELEYYPYAVLEPAAAGVPLICSNLPCVNELLRDREEYLAFTPRDAADLARQIVALAKDRQAAREMAERARRRVQEVCDWKRIAADYARLYRDTIGVEATRALVESNEGLLPAAPLSAAPLPGVAPSAAIGSSPAAASGDLP
ncbi:MAG TPA: glycosyltransferase family 4 protein [Polyangiaceae bacterium]|nr:glycosyltransferase family 4 protein [Polyangiaceae bacterium]